MLAPFTTSAMNRIFPLVSLLCVQDFISIGAPVLDDDFDLIDTIPSFFAVNLIVTPYSPG